MTVSSVLRERFIGTTMTLYKKDNPTSFNSRFHHTPNFGGVSVDCGYEMELEMN